ncbi:MAG: outer membrane protein assembly factor BamD [Gammaproteobacteria bacterium]
MTQRLACLLLVVALAATAGCSSTRKDERDPSDTARRLFDRSNELIESGNFVAGIGGLEGLTAIYPFSQEARQAQLILMYAYWRNDQPDAAVTAADRFILENPTHPRVDYALYIKGLARFPSEPGILERLFRVDMDKRPPGEMQASFNTFAQLIQQHPRSMYVEDARQRMIYLRNRLAAHELTVAQFYADRHAHVAAINRARYIVENFQETPSMVPALRIMARGYERLGLNELAADTHQVIAANSP